MTKHVAQKHELKDYLWYYSSWQSVEINEWKKSLASNGEHVLLATAY